MTDLLIAESAAGNLAPLAMALRKNGHGMAMVGVGEVDERLGADEFRVLIIELNDGSAADFAVMGDIRRKHPGLPVIVTSANHSTEAAIRAMSAGVYDHFAGPLDLPQLLRRAEEALDSYRRAAERVDLQAKGAFISGENLIGDSPAMQAVYKQVGRVAATAATVLIHGESGSGKELIARAIHRHSLRAAAPLVVVNCAAIPENLIESKLFGHVKGAFTGAADDRAGSFETAHGGTLFLDEIGELSTAVQAKLLRAIQYHQVERVGSNDLIDVDVRIIAATNRDLAAEVEDGRFREDLFHRLHVMPIHVPPLRQRREDIPQLVNYFYTRYAANNTLPPSPVAADALELLCNHDWPGNVRELEHVIQRALILASGYLITADTLRPLLAHPSGESDGPAAVGNDADNLESVLRGRAERFLAAAPGKKPHRDFMAAAETAIVAAALRQTEGNQSQAATVLGISRPSVQAKMKKYDIGREVSIRA